MSMLNDDARRGREALLGIGRSFGEEVKTVDRDLETNITATAFPRPRLRVYTSVEGLRVGVEPLKLRNN